MDIMRHPCIKEPTRANIMDLLEQQTQDALAHGRDLWPAESFFPEGAEADIEQARQWWPTDAPRTLQWELTLGGCIGMRGERPSQLLTHIQNQANRVVAWLKAEGRDTVRPNETKSERMARMNRERAAAYRQGQRAAGDGERPAASVAWDAVVAARRERKRYKDSMDEMVREYYNKMTEASEARAAGIAKHDAIVEAAEQAHRQLRGKS